jgi:hypothetical protein
VPSPTLPPAPINVSGLRCWLLPAIGPQRFDLEGAV